jgi:hypothetical protein
MKKKTAQIRRTPGGTKLMVCAAFLVLGLVSCNTEDSIPCPVYMSNHSGYRLCIEISQTQEFCEDTEVFYHLDDSDSLFLGYFPNGYSFWLWGWVDDARAADTSRFIEDPVEIGVSGKTTLYLDDSLGEPVLRVFH